MAFDSPRQNSRDPRDPYDPRDPRSPRSTAEYPDELASEQTPGGGAQPLTHRSAGPRSILAASERQAGQAVSNGQTASVAQPANPAQKSSRHIPQAVSNEPPPDTRFKTFGVLPEMQQSKGSTVSSIAIMSVVVALILIIGSQAKKVIQVDKVTKLEAPIPVKEVKPQETPKPKIEPKPLPKPPKIEPPKIHNMPKIEVPEPPKIQTPMMKAAPIPIPTPAPPLKVTPPPAPVQIAINKPQAASIANNSPHPTAIRAGSMTNPINNTSGPKVSNINLGHSGAPGMPAGNTGLGPASKINIGGNGAPNGSMGGTGRGPVAIGVKNGVAGGTGPMTSRPTGAVQIARAAAPVAIQQQSAPAAPTKTAPKVLYKPKPEYTAEAKSLNITGVVTVRIRVSASGAVTVLGIQGAGLGHGLNEAAIRSVQQMRFQPAMANGHPTDWEGTVNITFQLAS